MTQENALGSSCSLSQSSWLYTLKWHYANQIYKPLPPTAPLHSQPKKCPGGSSSVEEQWHLVPGAAARQLRGHRTSGHQAPLLQHLTIAPRSFPPWLPACLYTQVERQRKETLSRCKDRQESGAKDRQPDRKTGLGTQWFIDPHLSTV